MQNLASRLSALYDGEQCIPSQAEIDQLVDFINAEFKRIPHPVIFIDHDINLPDAMARLRDHGVLLISTANNYHPHLTHEQNAKFRAVHDHHHAEAGADSTLSGEIKAFNHARKHAPRTIYWLLFSEIVLQAAACIHHGEFQPQKLVKAGGF